VELLPGLTALRIATRDIQLLVYNIHTGVHQPLITIGKDISDFSVPWDRISEVEPVNFIQTVQKEAMVLVPSSHLPTVFVFLPSIIPLPFLVPIAEIHPSIRPPIS
jgi:hypothetical protein